MLAYKKSLPVLYYVHDPMCSWCWGFRSTWLQLQKKLNNKVTIKYIVGGLAPDTDLAMSVAMQELIQNTWKKIQQEIPGTEFNYDFWTSCQPRRSTYPACRAIIACKMQRPDLEKEMLLAIQQAYYLNARNPSDNDVLVQVAKTVGLDPEIFVRDINSEVCQKLFEDELRLVKELYVNSFPALVLSYEKNDSAITINYNDSGHMYQQIIDKI